MGEAQEWKPGDVIIVEAPTAGDPHRTGEILRVLGEPGHPHFEVRWDDGRETIFYPSGETALRHATPRG